MTTGYNDSQVEDGLRPTQSQRSESVSKGMAQYTVDTRLQAVFDQPDRSFDYSQSVRVATPLQSVPEQQITTYLSKIQRGGCIQLFGATLAVDEHSFCLLAFSEKVPDLLDLPNPVPSLDPSSPHRRLPLGSNVCSLFTPSSALLHERATSAREITLLNPLWIHSHASGKPFYAILHRIDIGIIIDLEPARSEDPALSVAGAVQSQKLAMPPPFFSHS